MTSGTVLYSVATPGFSRKLAKEDNIHYFQLHFTTITMAGSLTSRPKGQQTLLGMAKAIENFFSNSMHLKGNIVGSTLLKLLPKFRMRI